MRIKPDSLPRTYRYRIYPTANQKLALESQLAFACDLYNAALEQRREAWRRRRQPLTYFSQCHELTDVRAAGLGPTGMSCFAMREPLRRLDRAFAAFFRRLKAGHERPGYPRFRARRRYDSLSWNALKLCSGRLVVPGVGHIRVRWHRPLPAGAPVRTVTVRRHARHWYVGFALQLQRPAPLPATGESVGIDLGIVTFATLSTGEWLKGPRASRTLRRRLRVAQRRVTRRRPGSSRRRRAAGLVRRLHERARNLRRDRAFKLAKYLVRRFDVIYVEALNLKGLARGRAARDVQDQGWGKFIAILTDKAAEAGRSVVAMSPRNTSQACSACGALVPKLPEERWHRCDCGYEADRDLNAARNLYRLGVSLQAKTWPAGRALPEKTLLALGGSSPL